MKWATRAGVHVDRVACAWLIRRHIDPQAEFHFVANGGSAPPDTTPFDMRGVRLSHHGGDCSFVGGLIFDGRYEFHRQRLLTGREPA